MENDLIDRPELGQTPRPRGMFLLALVVILILSFAGGVFLSFIKIRTILHSGPLVFGLGAFVLTVALITKNKLGILMGCISVLSVILLLAYIYFFRLTPRVAQGIVPFLASVGFIGTLIVGVMMFKRTSN